MSSVDRINETETFTHELRLVTVRIPKNETKTQMEISGKVAGTKYRRILAVPQ